jgi:hypothetical protein
MLTTIYYLLLKECQANPNIGPKQIGSQNNKRKEKPEIIHIGRDKFSKFLPTMTVDKSQ